MPASSARGTFPSSPTTPLQRNRGTFLFLWYCGHKDALGVPGGARTTDLVASPSCESRSPRFHPKSLAEPLRGVVCARRGPLPSGAETSGAGCGESRGRAPGASVGPSPAWQWRRHSRPLPAPLRPPRPGHDTARARTGLSPRPPWRGRRAPANDGEGAVRARLARPTPAAAL